MKDFTAGAHSREVWSQVADVVAAIEELPFLTELTRGTLEPRPFVNYILQDELYLNGYARAMGLLAAHAPDPEHTRFWAESIAETIHAEQQMHASLMRAEHLGAARAEFLDRGGPEPSPTTLGYTSYLLAQAATAPYPVGAAAILPCFWVYAHIGAVIVSRVDDLEGHPYREWIATYDSPAFDRATAQAVEIYEALAAEDPGTRGAMETAFVRATGYELRFWSAAHQLEDWAPRPGTPSR